MRRVRRAATSQNQSHVQQNIIYIFTMAQVKVNNVGRAIPSVYTDDQRREHRRELDGIFIGIAHSGTRYLDFDPDVCIYGLVCCINLLVHDSTLLMVTLTFFSKINAGSKRENHDRFRLAEGRAGDDPITIIYDWQLLMNARHSYFLAFERTLRLFGYSLRPQIRTEWEAHEGQRFQYSRMLRLYLDQVIVPAGGRVMVSTSPDATDVPYLHIQMLELMARIMTVGMESLVWGYITSSKNYNKLFSCFFRAHLANCIFSFSFQKDQNRARQTFTQESCEYQASDHGQWKTIYVSSVGYQHELMHADICSFFLTY